jgi:AraC-like DNA-binding protein
LLLAHVDPVARDATLLAVTRAHQRLSSTAFARLMARPRRSLATVLERAGFPPTQRLLMWGRLIVAGHLLEDTRRSADRVAESLGFPSGSAFRNACQRYVGLAPSEIRAAGGSVCVAEAFLRQLTPQTKAPPDVTTLEPRASNARKSGAVVAPPSETEQPPPRSEPGSPRRPSKPVIKPLAGVG